MNVPASTHHINDATSSAQTVLHSQTSLLPENTTWVSRPGPCKEFIPTEHVRTRPFRLVRQETPRGSASVTAV